MCLLNHLQSLFFWQLKKLWFIRSSFLPPRTLSIHNLNILQRPDPFIAYFMWLIYCLSLKPFTHKKNCITNKSAGNEVHVMPLYKSQNDLKFTLWKKTLTQLNPSLNTPGVTGRFLQQRCASGTLYHLILDLVFVPQNWNLFSKLILCHRFSRTNFVVSVFLRFCFVFCFTAPLTPCRVDMCALQVLLLLLLWRSLFYAIYDTSYRAGSRLWIWGAKGVMLFKGSGYYW